MPSNLIIFDAEYVSELTSRMNMACDLMADAVSSLRSAQSHENWKCKERNRILEDFDELNQRLGRLDTGVNETTRILGGSVSRVPGQRSVRRAHQQLRVLCLSAHGRRCIGGHGCSVRRRCSSRWCRGCWCRSCRGRCRYRCGCRRKRARRTRPAWCRRSRRTWGRGRYSRKNGRTHPRRKAGQSQHRPEYRSRRNSSNEQRQSPRNAYPR